MHQSDRWYAGDGALQSDSRLALASSCSTEEDMRDCFHDGAGTRTGGYLQPSLLLSPRLSLEPSARKIQRRLPGRPGRRDPGANRHQLLTGPPRQS
ncbi:hypothetical protein HF521_021119 [Silurus meridionalis]|uniref:Uncharacterized protein n=1 Tax=Silurus meridionalis TaxID=175797 RepID=A0A8T0BDU5_SILME|nr:hypothetical protein HF521_021119 [Silurus meridionalis]